MDKINDISYKNVLSENISGFSGRDKEKSSTLAM